MKGFINIDMHSYFAADYVGDIRRLPCRSNTVERIENYHVIEHISHVQVKGVLTEWYRVLKPGGRIVIECPDLDAAVKEYLDGNEERLYSIYGRQRFRGDAHYNGFNGERLCRLLTQVGFTNPVVCDAQDYHATSEPCLRVEAEKSAAQ